ncbi:MAG: elongation factor P [Candidatus Cloacimonadota bacterium]|nr:MAG: elongation factor P [Candidatus Cloacimonadota bacterium]
MATASDIKKGLNIRYKNGIYTIIDFLHVKPGKGGAFVRLKLKNIETGQVLDDTIRAGAQIDVIRIERRPYQYLYNDGEQFYFMDKNTYEQVPFHRDVLSEVTNFLKEGIDVTCLFAEGKQVGIEPPMFIELTVTETEPGHKGDTVSTGTKPATTETGLKVNIPLFINVGDMIKVDTRTSEYIERV